LEWLIEDQLYLLKVLDEKKLKAKGKTVSESLLNYPFFQDTVRNSFSDLVAVNPILLRMAHDCEALLSQMRQKDECYGHNDLLHAVKQALNNDSFLHFIRAKYRVAIIDEFQDTDPTQWQIFQRLFLPDSHSTSLFYLVGDPKQSIYAFRQ